MRVIVSSMKILKGKNNDLSLHEGLNDNSEELNITLRERRSTLLKLIDVTNESHDIEPIANELGGIGSIPELTKIENKIASNDRELERLRERMERDQTPRQFALAVRMGEIIQENDALRKSREEVMNVPVVDVIDSVPFLRADLERMHGLPYEDLLKMQQNQPESMDEFIDSSKAA